MIETEKSCRNCAHRAGDRCERTGFYYEVEVKFGGRCADGKTGTALVLWAPRKGVVPRFKEWLFGQDKEQA